MQISSMDSQKYADTEVEHEVHRNSAMPEAMVVVPLSAGSQVRSSIANTRR